MRKVFVTAVVALATTLFLSTAHAGNSRHGWKKRAPIIGVNIDAQDCSVTLKTRHNLNKIVLTDDRGRFLKKWHARGRTFSNFGMYTALMTEGRLYVKARVKVRTYRGKWRHRTVIVEAGNRFRNKLQSCLDNITPPPPPTGPVCPAAVLTAVDAAVASVNPEDLGITDDGNSCQVFGLTQVGIFNGLSFDNGQVIGASIQNADGSNSQIPLSLEKANQCVAAIGRCPDYNNRL